MIKEFKEYEPIDYKSMKKQVAYLKNIFDDYTHAQSFADHLYQDFGHKSPQKVGFGVTANYSFYPIMEKISEHLIKNKFKLDIGELERTYHTLYFREELNSFIKGWMKTVEPEGHKYYYFGMIKQSMWIKNDTMTPDEKVSHIKEYFSHTSNSHLQKKYDLDAAIHGGMIHVNLINKKTI